MWQTPNLGSLTFDMQLALSYFSLLEAEGYIFFSWTPEEVVNDFLFFVVQQPLVGFVETNAWKGISVMTY